MQKLNSYTAQDRADMVIRVVHPQLAVEKLGLTMQQVMARRKELGVPPVDEQFKKLEVRQRSNGRELE